MSEETNKTTEVNATKETNEHKEPKVRVEHGPVRREKKASRWTLKVCLKVASRFSSEEEWKNGAPSSYKAACAHEWKTECLKHLHGKTSHTKHDVKWQKSA